MVCRGEDNMKATGIVRKVDELGRIVIPKELRVNMGMNIGQPVEIFIDKDNIILQKYQAGCIFCGEIYDTVEFKGKPVCRNCIKSI